MIKGNYALQHLDILESESIYILREVAGQFRNPVMLFSGGKDSILMSHLAEKAFRPGKFPFSLMLVDTGHNFPETIQYIDSRMKSLGEKLIVASVEKSIQEGRVKEESGPYASRNRLQSVTLMDAIREKKFDAVIGGGRRDEEKARAKERIFSHRDEFGQWDPKNQRPELWNLYNGHLGSGEHMRVFPISNWTELDVWQYIEREKIKIPDIYFSHRRRCIKREGQYLAYAEFMQLAPTDELVDLTVRCRTVGDMTCTGVFPSQAANISEIIQEILVSRITERGGRMDDKKSESAMEDRKKEGYF